MDMPMGLVARGGADPMPTEPPVAPTAEAGEMAGMNEMPGMATAEPTGTGMGQAASAGMAGMTDGGWTWDGLTTFVVAWAVMMAAMMFPAAAPMLLLFRTISTSRGVRGVAVVPTWIFAAGYLVVWTGMGVLTWLLVQVGSDVASRVNASDRRDWAPIALGMVLLVAGLYQLTPLKRVCLDHCRTPMGFVMGHWRDGRSGALRMGFIHGVYCLGCCWALFAVLVAAGVMSLAWMLFLTLVVFAEKVLPIGRWGPRVVGAAFLVLGGVVAAGAMDMPWVA
jgi:predicted metal-binding membrane protein